MRGAAEPHAGSEERHISGHGRTQRFGKKMPGNRPDQFGRRDWGGDSGLPIGLPGCADGCASASRRHQRVPAYGIMNSDPRSFPVLDDGQHCAEQRYAMGEIECSVDGIDDKCE